MSHALALLTFFLAFYTSTCHTRFMEQYNAIKAIEGHMRSVGIRVRNLYKAEEEIAQLDMMELFRYLCGSYFLLFVRLYDGTLHKFDLSSAVERGLVTVEERNILEKHSPGMRWMKMISWAFGHAVKVAEREEMGDLDLGSTQHEILQIRETMNAVTYKFQMPVPLAYYHVITVLVIVVTMLYSYAMAYSEDISPALVWLVWGVVVFGFMGMREVAIQLAEPFGDDDCDLPVDNYVYNIMAFLSVFASEDEKEREKQTFQGDTYWLDKHVVDKKARHRLTAILRTGLVVNGFATKAASPGSDGSDLLQSTPDASAPKTKSPSSPKRKSPRSPKNNSVSRKRRSSADSSDGELPDANESLLGLREKIKISKDVDKLEVLKVMISSLGRLCYGFRTWKARYMNDDNVTLTRSKSSLI